MQPRDKDKTMVDTQVFNLLAIASHIIHLSHGFLMNGCEILSIDLL